jgi:hypothetical protein
MRAQTRMRSAGWARQRTMPFRLAAAVFATLGLVSNEAARVHLAA